MTHYVSAAKANAARAHHRNRNAQDDTPVAVVIPLRRKPRMLTDVEREQYFALSNADQRAHSGRKREWEYLATKQEAAGGKPADELRRFMRREDSLHGMPHDVVDFGAAFAALERAEKR